MPSAGALRGEARRFAAPGYVSRCDERDRPLIGERGAPKASCSDNGPEFISIRPLQWAADEGWQMTLLQPGRPWQNGTDESFNGKFRDECQSMEYFRSRLEARFIVEQWCNEVRRILLRVAWPLHSSFRTSQAATTRSFVLRNSWSEEPGRVS